MSLKRHLKQLTTHRSCLTAADFLAECGSFSTPHSDCFWSEATSETSSFTGVFRYFSGILEADSKTRIFSSSGFQREADPAVSGLFLEVSVYRVDIFKVEKILFPAHNL